MTGILKGFHIHIMMMLEGFLQNQKSGWGTHIISIHISLQFHVLLYYKPASKSNRSSKRII